MSDKDLAEERKMRYVAMAGDGDTKHWADQSFAMLSAAGVLMAKADVEPPDENKLHLIGVIVLAAYLEELMRTGKADVRIMENPTNDEETGLMATMMGSIH